MKVAIIGLGLIGGSFALALKQHKLSKHIIGVDSKPTHLEDAHNLRIIDTKANLQEAVQQADLIVIAIPVNAIPSVLVQVLDMIKDSQIVIDMGSTKQVIARQVANHPNRKRYVACHPIAGTENTGPAAAFPSLYRNKVNIICDKEKSCNEALKVVMPIFETLEMKIIFMESSAHDKHIAYVSHLSHVSSFALGKTVLEIEKSEKTIFNMAGSGFASTVRLAKSSPDMWTPIFDANAENISKALQAYIENLLELKHYIDNHKTTNTHNLMTKVNDIKRILNGMDLSK